MSVTVTLEGPSAARAAETIHVLNAMPFFATVEFEGKRCEVVSIQSCDRIPVKIVLIAADCIDTGNDEPCPEVYDYFEDWCDWCQANEEPPGAGCRSVWPDGGGLGTPCGVSASPILTGSTTPANSQQPPCLSLRPV